MDRHVRAALYLAPLMLVFPTQPALADCPHLVPGAPYPWQSEELMPGDKWADLSITLDKKGHPIDCKSSKGNVDPETLFYMCQAILREGEFEPIIRDGQPVEGTIPRHMMMPGRNHVRADEAARKKYFAEHPDQKSSCYP